jgi:hypothetical protein
MFSKLKKKYFIFIMVSNISRETVWRKYPAFYKRVKREILLLVFPYKGCRHELKL